jgi:hypothetical protein
MGDVVDDNGIIMVDNAGIRKVFSLTSYFGAVPTGEIYFNEEGRLALQSDDGILLFGGTIYLGGLLALFSAARGEKVVGIIRTLINDINTFALAASVASSPLLASSLILIEQLTELSYVLNDVNSPDVRVS